MTFPLRLAVFAAVLLAPIGDGDVAGKAESQTVRIGVYVRDGFDSCLRNWMPTAEHLTRTIQGYNFIVVPLASREDIYDYLQEKKIDFLISNAAIHALHGRAVWDQCSGGTNLHGRSVGTRVHRNLIRKADRTDLTRVDDIADAQLSAVKPWSFGGWIMQRRALQVHGVDPLRSGTAVEFQGTHEDVIQAVLDGRADVGAVATDLLEERIKSGTLDPKELFVFNTEGEAVPLGSKEIPSTQGYPDWVFARSATTAEPLAERVLQSLIFRKSDSGTDVAGDSRTWTVPQNGENVRQTLREMIGPDYAYTDGMTLVADPFFFACGNWRRLCQCDHARGDSVRGLAARSAARSSRSRRYRDDPRRIERGSRQQASAGDDSHQSPLRH